MRKRLFRGFLNPDLHHAQYDRFPGNTSLFFHLFWQMFPGNTSQNLDPRGLYPFRREVFCSSYSLEFGFRQRLLNSSPFPSRTFRLGPSASVPVSSVVSLYPAITRVTRSRPRWHVS